MSQFTVGKKKFEQVYLKYYPVLMVYGRTIVADESLIEDTIQELFLKLWEKQNDLFIKTSLDSYLLVAFRNNLIRKLKENSQGVPNLELMQEETPELLLKKEEELRTLFNKLPPRQKEVLFLRYYKGKSYQEIANILGISYQVARNFSYRGIKFLRKNMLQIYSFALSIAI